MSPRKKPRHHLTKAGRLFLAVAGGLYFAALTSQSGLLLFVIGIVLGCYVINFRVAVRTVRRLRLKVPERTRLPERGRPVEPWELAIEGQPEARLVAVVGPDRTPWFRSARIVAQRPVRGLPEAQVIRRGVYPLTGLCLTCEAPFGLIQAMHPLQGSQEILVYPAVYTAPEPAAAGYDVMVGGKLRGKSGTVSGSEFAGVRPHTPRDPLKHIHWKASSKGLGLMTKSFEEELSGRAGFLLDPGHSGDADRLDDALRAAASLMFAALDAGNHVEWTDLTARSRFLVPPFADGQEMLDGLARIEMNPNCQTESAFRDALDGFSRKAAQHWILTDWTPVAAMALRTRQHRHRSLSLYLPEPADGVAGAGPATETQRVELWYYGPDGLRRES